MTASKPRVLLFDVMGTVVDDDGCVRRDTTTVLTGAGLHSSDIERVLGESGERLGRSMADVTAHRREWQGHRALRILAMRETLVALDLPALDDDSEHEIAHVVDHFDPWPDSADAIERLRRCAITVALSNADTDELAAMSAFGGLAWHAALSGELARAYKPGRVVYEMALGLLRVAPEQTLMVAAHPWDLRAATELGLATAFVNRPGAQQPRPDDRFDISVEDLAELATILEGER